MTTIAKATIKGQITLPIGWRRRFSTDRFVMEDEGEILKIKPLDLEEGFVTVFDAQRDNAGVGIEAQKLLKILKKINGQDRKALSKNKQKG